MMAASRAYGDVRDQILLEFEVRVFNNIKVTGAVPLSQYDVVPGQFRSTDYLLSDINQILSTDFLAYVGWNKLDYVTQQYSSTNQFTYNYSQSGNKLSGRPTHALGRCWDSAKFPTGGKTIMVRHLIPQVT